ncbi:MAG: DUF1801 domain-containing protein [Parvibaculum sp.]|nr:DUF1801 domain-containing protein [Parvibaculum sp.]
MTNRKTLTHPSPKSDPSVKAIFDAYPAPVRKRLLNLRKLIFATAAETSGVGEIVETLKWNQPAYLTQKPKSGTTIRLDALKGDAGTYALYVPCSTTLVATYKELYSDVLRFEGNRAVVFSARDEVPKDVVRHCLALALTYHLRK